MTPPPPPPPGANHFLLLLQFHKAQRHSLRALSLNRHNIIIQLRATQAVHTTRATDTTTSTGQRNDYRVGAYPRCITKLKQWHLLQNNEKSSWQKSGGVKNFLLRYLVMERLMGRPTLFPGSCGFLLQAATNPPELEAPSQQAPKEAPCSHITSQVALCNPFEKS